MDSTYYQDGKSFYAGGKAVIVAENEAGETHVYDGVSRKQLSTVDLKFGRVFGGGKEADVESTHVVMESGFLQYLCGGGEGGTVGTAEVTLNGGTIGGYLYGAGINDSVDKIKVTVNGGVIKRGFYGAGEALKCGDTELIMNNIISTKFFTGTKNEEGQQIGNVKMTMKDGVILNLCCGGGGVSNGDVDITISGGFIEKQFVNKSVTGKISLHLYEGIFQENGMVEEPFPLIPEGMDVDCFKSDYSWDFKRYIEHKEQVLDITGDEGKLVLHFFELRKPEVPKYTALFSHFIGDCILVSFPNGQHMLVDTGMPYSAQEVMSSLRELRVNKIDYLVLTHAHIDHLGNAPALLNEFEVGQVILPDVKPVVPDGNNKNAYLDTLETIIDLNTPVRKVFRGETLMVGEGDKRCDVLFLNPSAPRIIANDINAESVALKITFKDTSAVLGGDITDSIEKDITETYGNGLKTDVLKLSHHGITSQTYYEYVDACAPKYVVNHNLRENGVFMRTTRYALNHVHHIPDDRIFVTGAHGMIKAVLDGTKDGVKISTQYE